MLDATGMRALKDLNKQCLKNKTQLLLSGIHVQPFFSMEKAGFLDDMGRDNFHNTIDESLKRAHEILALKNH
ncbi:MAG: hypothetical protein ACD_73C00482G0001, partial [uncultured bacterium]